MAKNYSLDDYARNYSKKQYEKDLKSKTARNKAVKKYNGEHYKSLQAFLDKDLVEDFKSLVKKLGLKQSDVIRYFVSDFTVNFKDYIKAVNDFNSEDKAELKEVENYEFQRFEEKALKLLEIKDKEELYMVLHSPYQYFNVKELNRLSDYFGIQIDNRKSRSELLFKIYNYILSKKAEA